MVRVNKSNMLFDVVIKLYCRTWYTWVHSTIKQYIACVDMCRVQQQTSEMKNQNLWRPSSRELSLCVLLHCSH